MPEREEKDFKTKIYGFAIAATQLVLAGFLVIIVIYGTLTLHNYSKRYSPRRVLSLSDRVIQASEARLESALSGLSVGLPSEFLIFEHLQTLRDLGYDPMWKKDRYILKDQITGKEINPFLSQRKRIKSFDPARELSVTEYFTYQANSLYLRDLINDFPSYYTYLYLYELYGIQVALKDKGYVLLDEKTGNESTINFDGIMLRDEAARYNLNSKLYHDVQRMAITEAFLRDHGVIPEKRGSGYILLNLKTGERVMFPAKRAVVARSLQTINDWAGELGKDFLTPKEFRRRVSDYGIDGDKMSIAGMVAEEFLKLYDVQIQWNNDAKRYEISK